MKIKIIPFDLDTAKKIQSGEIEGKIKTITNRDVRIICWDGVDIETPIAFLSQDDPDYLCEQLHECNLMGEYTEGYGCNAKIKTLVLEVEDNEPQFKPFDKVLVRNDNEEIWQPRLYEMYSYGIEKHYCQDCLGYLQCIPYEGNEHIAGTTNNPDK